MRDVTWKATMPPLGRIWPGRGMSAFSQDNGRTPHAVSDLLYNEDKWQDKPKPPETLPSLMRSRE